jgi:hypothetical protein
MSQELKKCTYCKKEYPKTSEYFFEVYHSKRKKKYLDSRCKDCSRKLSREYRKEHAEKFRDTQRKWTQTPKGAYKSLKNSTRGHLVKITQEKFVEWYQSQPRTCFYCGIAEPELQQIKDAYNNKTYRLSIDRVDSTKDYEEGNLVLCCLRCNHIKGDFFTQSEMVEIGQKFIARKWENARQH